MDDALVSMLVPREGVIVFVLPNLSSFVDLLMLSHWRGIGLLSSFLFGLHEGQVLVVGGTLEPLLAIVYLLPDHAAFTMVVRRVNCIFL